MCTYGNMCYRTDFGTGESYGHVRGHVVMIYRILNKEGNAHGATGSESGMSGVNGNQGRRPELAREYRSLGKRVGNCSKGVPRVSERFGT